LEFDRNGGLSGLFEAGLAFERELYMDAASRYPLNSTVFLRGGLTY